MASGHSLNIAPRGDREIVIERAFSAPRARVWDAFTKPALISRWLGVFDQYVMDICEVDLRVGGSVLSLVDRKRGRPESRRQKQAAPQSSEEGNHCCQGILPTIAPTLNVLIANAMP